jgi:hypothetical protein
MPDWSTWGGTKSLKMKRRSSAMSERLDAFARRVREVQKWKVLYGEKQRLLGKSLRNSTRLMVELIQLERRKPEDVRLVKVMPGLLDALSREKQILERLGASNVTTRDYGGFRDFLQRLSEEQPPVLKPQAWEAQCSNKQRLLLNSMKKTARSIREIVALERRKPKFKVHFPKHRDADAACVPAQSLSVRFDPNNARTTFRCFCG